MAPVALDTDSVNNLTKNKRASPGYERCPSLRVLRLSSLLLVNQISPTCQRLVSRLFNRIPSNTFPESHAIYDLPLDRRRSDCLPIGNLAEV
jgi:hypothetical protein